MGFPVKELNNILRDLVSLRAKKPIDTIQTDDSEFFYEIYKINDDCYVKLELFKDSYGGDNRITGLTFVKPRKIDVIEFKNFKEIE